MTADRRRAAQRLAQGDVTCALCRGEELLTDTRRGVAPLLALLDSGRDLTGYAAADKVVGKAAAFLYVRLGVTHVYAPVMSEPARAVLTAHGIEAAWDTCPPAIRNRAGDGYCPMERAVWDLTDPAEAEKVVRWTLAALTAAKG